jgi:hypothetical protein
MKVKSMLVGIDQPTPQIDWNKPQMFKYTGELGIDLVVLSSGVHSGTMFHATVVLANRTNHRFVGEQVDDFSKDLFKPFNPDQQVILQNSND